MLRVQNLHAGYGASQVLNGVNLEVKAGSVVALIGANGAGKTTTMRAVSGLIHPTKGEVTLDGKAVTSLGAAQIARLGMAHSPEGRKVFGPLTVEDNLLLGAYTRLPRFLGYRGQAQKGLDRVYEMFPRLAERKNNLGTQLSGGEQQMLAVGRALVLNPRLLLLDEPLEGLAPIIVEELLRAISRITREEGLSAIIVEQHPQAILAISDKAIVLDHGEVVHTGTAEELRSQPALLDKLLGVTQKTL